MDKTEAKKIVGRPYHDLSTPFTVDEAGAFAEYIIQDPDSMAELALSSNVIIKDKRMGHDCWVSGRIVGLRAISPFNPERENMLYIEDETIDPTRVLDEVTGPHTHQPMIIRVKLDHELEMDQSGSDARKFQTLPVQRPPSAISRMMFPEIVPLNEKDEAPSLRDILQIKSDGIPLGSVGFGNTPYESKGVFLDYKWDVDSLDNKHIFIVGESGSGKTVFLKNLAYELRKHNSQNRVILTDVQGDITQLVVSDVANILKPRGWQERVKRETPQEAIKHLEKFQLIIPAKKEGSSSNVIALKKLAQNRGVMVKEVGLRLQDLSRPSDVEYLFRVTSDQAAVLLDEEAEYLKSTGKVASIANLRGVINQRISSAGSSNTAQVASGGGTSYYVTTFRATLRAMKSLEEYFDFHQASLSQVDNPLDCFDFDGTSILFLDELDRDERIMWEMQLMKWLYDHKKDPWNAYVFVDEAHQVIPAKPMGLGSLETFDRLRINFENLAREGRKFGINLILSTQNPKDLHPVVPEQCHTKIVMKINPKNAAHAFLDPELAPIATRFSSGQFWIQSVDNGSINWVRVHSWAPPLPHESMTSFWKKIEEKAKSES